MSPFLFCVCLTTRLYFVFALLTHGVSIDRHSWLSILHTEL